MKPFALTGGIGSGKSTVSKLLTLMGARVYNADQAAKSLYNRPGVISAVAELFGDACIVNGTVDFKLLAGVVFKDKSRLADLNKLIHPLLFNDFLSWHQRQADHLLCIMEAAILFEAGMEDSFDGVICVTAPAELCIQRVMARDGMSRSEVLARMSAQMDPEVKAARSDYILINDDEHLLIPQTEALYHQLLSQHA